MTWRILARLITALETALSQIPRPETHSSGCDVPGVQDCCEVALKRTQRARERAL